MDTFFLIFINEFDFFLKQFCKSYLTGRDDGRNQYRLKWVFFKKRKGQLNVIVNGYKCIFDQFRDSNYWNG